MKKNILLLFALICLALAPTAQAQNYTPASYDVVANGDPWNSIAGQGTDIPELAPTSQYDDCRVSNEITIPGGFVYRFCNTLTSVFRCESDGNIICGALSWPDNVQDCDQNSYQCFSFGCSGNSTIFDPQVTQFGGQNANNTIRPWSGFHTVNQGSTTKYNYLVQGVAPKRTCTIQADRISNEGSSFGIPLNTCSWQVVLYEAQPNSGFISKIQMNYGPSDNTNSWEFNNNYASYLVGIKTTGGCGGEMSLNTDQYTPIGGTPPFTTCGTLRNTGLPPTENFVFIIRYPHNLAFTNPNNYPADQQILLINTAFTPSIKVSNEGTLPFTKVRLNLQIVGDPANPYSSFVDLTPAQIPAIKGGTSPQISFPVPFTPLAYGYYTMIWTISTDPAYTVPGEDYVGDNTLTTTFIVSPPDNIAAIKTISPSPGTRTPVNIGAPVAFQYRNLGVNNQTNVPVSVYIKNPQGVVVYRDTQILNNWLSSQFRDTSFKDFTPTQVGDYTLCGVGLLAKDLLHSDDTVCSTFQVRYEADVAAISIFNPDDGQEMPEKKLFKPSAYFQSVGVRDLFNVPVRVQIKRCSDNSLVYQADTLLPELNVDQGAVRVSFPSQQGTFSTANLAPGCYQICAIARQVGDGDNSNDTVCSFFGVIARLQGNINVGVGQRFQTISAADDSMKFRGVGPNDLNLILTDANYSENGNTSVSTATAAVDFSGITGTGPTTETGKPTITKITWKPKKGVSPVITFTGSKQYCFNWTYKSTPYMIWDGNNQFNPTPDLVTPEPVKRGITIISNSTSPVGSVFNFQYGRHDITLKNLKIRNNGNLTNSLSSAIHLENIYTQISFVQGVRDTATNNNITIDNNEITNANTGISDIGTVPLFDINQALFFDRRNNNNRITRNTVGTQAWPIGGIGVVVGNEDGLYLGHNEISWVNGYAGSAYGGAIAVNSGNSINLWIDANKLHNVGSATASANTLVGIDVQQASTIYTQGSGAGQKRSTLPVTTANRITNNMIYDLRAGTLAATTIKPITMSTSSATYFVDKDSLFNNSLSVKDAPALITMTRSGRPFIWNNILQDLNNSANPNAVLYNLTVPRPMAANVSSDYNDIDLRNSLAFATLNEYDRATGTFIQTRTLKNLNEWRTFTQQDIHSVTGDPLFSSDSLHLPGATSYILSPASNNGAWLGTATQTNDFDGEARLVANNTPDIGADEFEGFQFVNDLAVQVITKPSGITDNAGVISVTAENPLAIQAIVKNQGSIQAFNRNATSKVEVSTNGGLTWNVVPNGINVITGLHFDVAESKVLDFQGPNIFNEAGKLFRVTVSVDPDQNNANNSISKVFKLLVKRAAVLLSYENSTAQGQRNKDSLAAALQRLGVPYDSLNRVTYGTAPIDYTPWWTLIWSTGDPGTAYNGPLGVGAISLKGSEEIINFLRAGQTYAKKSLVIAGENIAKYNDTTSAFRQNNNVITDNELMSQWLHTQFVARWPGLNWPTLAPVQYRGLLNGVGSYFRFPDSILSVPTTLGGGPNVVKVNPVTVPAVGENISRTAYNYAIHPSTPLDSGAGTAWTGSTFNSVFYAFDWSDPLQTQTTMDGQTAAGNVSGTTRFLRGALDFIQSFRGTVLPVEFTTVKGNALKTGNEITWSVAAQKSVDHYEVEMLSGNDWNWVGQAKASAATNYSFMHTASAAFEVGKTFTYRIVSVDLDGARTTSMTTSFGRSAEGALFSLEQNFPNPFNPSTMISFSLPSSGNVSLRILDMTGKVIATPVNGVDYSAGKTEVRFDAANLASGTYIYELSFVNANGEISKLSRKMTLSK